MASELHNMFCSKMDYEINFLGKYSVLWYIFDFGMLQKQITYALSRIEEIAYK